MLNNKQIRMLQLLDEQIQSCEKCELHKNGRAKPYWTKYSKFAIIGEAPGCISGDSLIEVAFRDKSKFPNGIQIKDLCGKKDFYVYSFDIKNECLSLGKVKKVWKTGIKPIYKVTYKWNYSPDLILYNSLKVTSNHKFLLRPYKKRDPFRGIQDDRLYVSIDDGLDIGYSLLPFIRRTTLGYSKIGVFNKDIRREGRFLLEFKIGRELDLNEQCHHDNLNKLDDSFNNLKLMTIEEHSRKHMLSKENPMKNSIYKKKHSEMLNSEEYKNITKEYVERKFKEKFPEENFPPIDNHIITSIEYVGEEDVYDMEVEKYHNFSTNNIFVHNSQEVEENKPFIGKAGNILWDTMADFNLKRSDFLIINSVNCRPVDGNKNGKPTKEQMDICYPWIRKYLKVLDPEKILTLGNYALWSMFKQEGISKRNGEIERLYEFNVNAYKSVHPAFCIYNREEGIEKLRYSIESFKEDIPF